MSDFEEQVRDGLRGYVTAVVPDDICVPGLPRARRAKGAPFAIAAAIAVLICVPLVITHSSVGTGHIHPAAQSTQGASIAANRIDVQGAVIPIPNGWHAEDVGGGALDYRDAYGFCLLHSSTVVGDESCLSAGGILVRVAKVLPQGQVAPLPGAFQDGCNGLMTVPIGNQGYIGKAAASVVTITCGSNLASSSTYWVNQDRTLTIQSPYDGDRSLAVAELIAHQLDISHWAHAGNIGSPQVHTSRGTK